jgi:hypothetical protein
MPHRDGYPQGVPSWVDLATGDLDGAKAFYGALFGWAMEDQEMPPGVDGYYTMAYLDGGSVAGIGNQPPDAPEGMPPVWTTYFAVDDVDEVVARVEGAGGTVMMPTMQIMGSGRMAMVVDPTGGMVGLWEAGEHKGAQVVNQHGALVWNELITPEPDTAADFYDAILGTTHETGPMGGDGDYTVINVDGRSVAGAMALPEHQGVPTAWTVYFATDDIDATVAKAEALGGTVMNRVDSPAGPLAVIADPQGAVFQVMQPLEMED